MRGENDNALASVKGTAGSSPHARGKPCALAGRVVSGRLIPACAGKTRVVNRLWLKPRAHPRMRGENMNLNKNIRTEQGSSPHARGKRRGNAHHREIAGLIPACAGKTTSYCPSYPCTGAHPRMRGENIKSVKYLIVSTGSSPHARGKLAYRPRPYPPVRLIPACAGKTSYSRSFL